MFPDKKTKIKKIKSKEKPKVKSTSSGGFTPFSWVRFERAPALYAEFNNKVLDKILANFDDFDPPPTACA